MISMIPLIILQGNTQYDLLCLTHLTVLYVFSLTVVHTVLLACSITGAPQQSAPTIDSQIYTQ